ncbi:MAG: sigma-54-dependent Fis family transcriptional regulator [Thermodesulfobacteriota bacterium]
MTTGPDASFYQKKQNLLDEGDLQEELSDIFRGVSNQIPADKINWVLSTFNPPRIGIIGQSSGTGGEKTNFIYDVPEKIVAVLQREDLPEFHLINHPEMDPLGKEIATRAKRFDWSALVLNFRIREDTLPSIMLYADGKNRYGEEHIRRLKPFTTRLQQVMEALIAENQRKGPDPLQKEPVTDKNEFFRQVTLRLCGHLDLQPGVSRCLQYISRFLPADGLFVRQLEPAFQSERVLAESFGLFHQQTGTLIPLVTRERHPADRGRTPRIRIINRPEQSLSMQPYTQIFGNDISCISMPLIHNKQAVGVAVLGLEGRDRYREEHLQLFSLLHDPLFLALSNNIKHREVIRLKNLIEEEKTTLAEALHYTAADTIIGGSLGLEAVMDKARLVADQDSPVLLSGETGTGKEIIANFIHQNSSRKDGPFIKVNCGAIPDTLVDSELFGHEKGAFTGAGTSQKGRFERADRGTIFLDEIADLPLAVQVRLLRVLQHKTIERVGGTDAISVDIRVIAATHRNLEERVASGQFREDLWFRLNVFPIQIPPLRSRKMDIPALVDYFIDKKSLDLKFHTRPLLSADAMDRLMSYEWPGNVRELENVVERELILNKNEALTFHNITPRQQEIREPDDEMTADHILSLDELFTRYVKRVLDLCDGKISGPDGAAEKLRVNPSTLRNRLKKMKIAYGWGKRRQRLIRIGNEEQAGYGFRPDQTTCRFRRGCP